MNGITDEVEIVEVLRVLRLSPLLVASFRHISSLIIFRFLKQFPHIFYRYKRHSREHVALYRLALRGKMNTMIG